jgi:hypothetical protein
MSTPKVDADDDVIPEFDFSRAIPSPFADRARKGMRFHILRADSDLPTYHVTARRRARSWWIEIDEIDGSGRPARWSTIESTARQVIARSRGIDPSDFDLVIDLPSNGNSR